MKLEKQDEQEEELKAQVEKSDQKRLIQEDITEQYSHINNI